MGKIPEKTIERLSKYRVAVLSYQAVGKHHIFSHQLASLLHITPVQVRRDLMLIGHTGTLRRGYEIQELIDNIGKILDTESGLRVAVIGLGNLGKAFISYLNGKRSKLSIVAAFDINNEKIGRNFAGIPCFHFDRLAEVVKEENISIGIISVPAEHAVYVAEMLVIAGVKGILNYSPKPLNVPQHVFLEEYDMITSLEKVAFFSKVQ
ncbi:MAG: redox-sensing transcriptional repressor Rex [Bacteroidota bacterium]